MFKNFTIYKRKEVKTGTQPTHDLVAMDEKYENKTTVGALWTRVAKDENGNDYKFLSGTLSKERTHDGKTYDGYVIITDKEYREYQELKKTTTVNTEVDTGEVVNIDDIPF